MESGIEVAQLTNYLQHPLSDFLGIVLGIVETYGALPTLNERILLARSGTRNKNHVTMLQGRIRQHGQGKT